MTYRRMDIIVLSDEPIESGQLPLPLPGGETPKLPAPVPDKPKETGNERLDYCLGVIFDVEGGYSDHPRDNGGPTNHGITQATLSHYRGRPVSVAEVKALSVAEAIDIYRQMYWTTVEADKLPSGIDLVVFDQSVNSGPRTSQLLLQRTINNLGEPIKVDGDIGRKTAEALSRLNYHAVIDEYSRVTMARYKRLSDWDVFGNGWTNRNKRVTKAAHMSVKQDNPMASQDTSVSRATVKHSQQDTERNGMSLTILELLLNRTAGYKTIIGVVLWAAVQMIEANAPNMLSPATDQSLLTLAYSLAGIGLIDKARRVMIWLGIDIPLEYQKKAKKQAPKFDPFEER